MAAYENTTFRTNVGEDRTLTITPTVSGSVSGWTLTFTATPIDGSASAITKTTGSGLTSVSGTGVTTVTISASDTSSRQPCVFEWTLRRTDSGNNTVVGKGLWHLDYAA